MTTATASNMEDSLLLAERRASDTTRPPGISLNGILVGALGTAVLMLLSFLALPLPNPFASLTGDPHAGLVLYNFQLPFAIFLGAFLGPALGGGSVLAFLLLGLFALPVFAGGGGTDYIAQPGFGFLLGMLLASWLTGKMIRRVLHASRPKRMATLFGVAFTAVLITYLAGALYGAGLALTDQMNWLSLENIIIRLGVEMFVYDVLAVAAWLAMVRYARLGFWLILY